MAQLDETTWAAVVDHEDTELGPRASAEAVAEFEALHGFTLPESHREFLLRGNGGAVGCARLFSIGRDDALDFGRHLSEMRPMIEAMADGPVIPFAKDWGGSYFCYDLSKAGGSGDHPVVYWNHEYSEEPDDRPMLWSAFAEDFVGFVKRVLS